jgi:two-component system OmpR family response regulator
MPMRDGMSLCRAMRADPALADLPFLFITARSTQAELYQEMERIGDGCVVKPFEPDDLLATIARVVAKRAASNRKGAVDSLRPDGT